MAICEAIFRGTPRPFEAFSKIFTLFGLTPRTPVNRCFLARTTVVPRGHPVYTQMYGGIDQWIPDFRRDLYSRFPEYPKIAWYGQLHFATNPLILIVES